MTREPRTAGLANPSNLLLPCRRLPPRAFHTSELPIDDDGAGGGKVPALASPLAAAVAAVTAADLASFQGNTVPRRTFCHASGPRATAAAAAEALNLLVMSGLFARGPVSGARFGCASLAGNRGR
jgi:hypothetical protein